MPEILCVGSCGRISLHSSALGSDFTSCGLLRHHYGYRLLHLFFAVGGPHTLLACESRRGARHEQLTALEATLRGQGEYMATTSVGEYGRVIKEKHHELGDRRH